MVLWYILWLFGIFKPVLVCCTKKNLATPSESKQKWNWLQQYLLVATSVPWLREGGVLLMKWDLFLTTYLSMYWVEYLFRGKNFCTWVVLIKCERSSFMPRYNIWCADAQLQIFALLQKLAFFLYGDQWHHSKLFLLQAGINTNTNTSHHHHHFSVYSPRHLNLSLFCPSSSALLIVRTYTLSI
jgi:hypothetical protein